MSAIAIGAAAPKVAKRKVVKTDNITQPLKATTQTSYFQTFVLCALVGPAFVLAWLWLGRQVLAPEDAETFKTFILGVWALLTGGSGGASLIGGVARTFGKIAMQKAGVLPELQATPAMEIPAAPDFPEAFNSQDYNLGASVGGNIHLPALSQEETADAQTFDVGELPSEEAAS